MTRRKRRLSLIGGGVGVLALGVALILVAFTRTGSIQFFYSPTEMVEKHVAPGTHMRLGGLVKLGSIVRGDDLTVRFAVTDGNREIAVAFMGIPPSLFRDGQGVIAVGTLDSAGVFKADEVLAKHDETYMPKEVADALKQQGRWKEGAGYRETQAGTASQEKAR